MLASPQLRWTPPSPRAIHLGPTEIPPPSRSLGYQGFLWCQANLLQPDGPNAGGPWKFTPEQLSFLLIWYQIGDDARFVWRNGVYRRIKGAGKNPFGAALCLLEFVGPCRFGGWTPKGLPIVSPQHSSWIQTAATSKDQTRNMMTLFPGMISQKLENQFAIDIGKEIIYANNGRSRIEAITSSPRAIEGGRPTFILKDETQHWLESNDGHEMDKVIARNAAKARAGAARALGLTNAHDPAEDSVAQRDYEAFNAMSEGKYKATGFLYDSLEAPPDTSLKDHDSLFDGIMAARGNSDWLDVERLIQEIWDPRTSPSDARRFYLNQIVAAEDAWIDPKDWDMVAAPRIKPELKDEITLGFDGSKTDDHCALVACRISDSHLFTIGVWDPQDFEDGEIPRLAIEGAVNRAFDTYLVNGFYSDVEQWESYVDKWELDFGHLVYAKAAPLHPIAWDMRGHRKDSTLGWESMHDAIIEKKLSHEGVRKTSQYVYNCRRRPNQYGISVGKESRMSTRKIDWAAAAMLARMCRQDYLALPENKKRRKKSGRAMFV